MPGLFANLTRSTYICTRPPCAYYLAQHFLVNFYLARRPKSNLTRTLTLTLEGAGSRQGRSRGPAACFGKKETGGRKFWKARPRPIRQMVVVHDLVYKVLYVVSLIEQGRCKSCERLSLVVFDLQAASCSLQMFTVHAIAEHLTVLLAWCKLFLRGRKPDVLRPDFVGMRGLIVLRLGPCIITVALAHTPPHPTIITRPSLSTPLASPSPSRASFISFRRGMESPVGS